MWAGRVRLARVLGFKIEMRPAHRDTGQYYIVINSFRLGQKGLFLGPDKMTFCPHSSVFSKEFVIYEKEGDLDCNALDDEARADTYRSGIWEGWGLIV